MKWGGVAAGAILALVAVVVLWGAGLVAPPEGLSRTIAALSALYPGPLRGAEIERIPCPPLESLRLYVVCTAGCAESWVIVGVRGLLPGNLANPGRIPPQPVEESRRRINAAVAAEGLRLDAGGAREMIGCYLRLEGFLPELVLTPAALVALEAAQGDEEEMRRVAEGLEAPDAVLRIDPETTPDGFRARLLYWDTARPGRPVLDLEFDLEADGVLRSLRARPSGRGGPALGAPGGG
ncbi:MAG: hypothetical protein HYS34_05425 [Acidobacteria bacterium]|nr:hypothetical protein [Acidobacteriota bacterium]